MYRRRRSHATRSWCRSRAPPSIILILLRPPERSDRYSRSTCRGSRVMSFLGSSTRRRDRVRAPGCGPGLEGPRREPASGSWGVAQWAGSRKTQVTRQDCASCGLDISDEESLHPSSLSATNVFIVGALVRSDSFANGRLRGIAALFCFVEKTFPDQLF